MSIVPASSLSAADLARLGNNLPIGNPPSPSHRRWRRRSTLLAVNRSLARLNEAVARLHRSPRYA